MIPEFTPEATYKDLFDPAMEIANRGDREEAAEYVAAHVKYLVNEYGSTAENAHEIVMINLGYYAGYYDQDTRRAVNEVFGASHPVFGDRYDMTAEELLDAGYLYAQRIKP